MTTGFPIPAIFFCAGSTVGVTVSSWRHSVTSQPVRGVVHIPVVMACGQPKLVPVNNCFCIDASHIYYGPSPVFATHNDPGLTSEWPCRDPMWPRSMTFRPRPVAAKRDFVYYAECRATVSSNTGDSLIFYTYKVCRLVTPTTIDTYSYFLRYLPVDSSRKNQTRK